MPPTRLAIVDQPSSCGSTNDATVDPDAMAALRVGLVNMPFSSSRRPAIQLGLLHAIAEDHGVDVTSHYFNLAFARRIGWALHEELCVGSCSLLIGEWLFAGAAFDDVPATQAYVGAFEEQLTHFMDRTGHTLADLVEVRDVSVPAFLEACLDETDWGSYDVVGFTSVFQQHCAALALARRIKQRHPHVTIIFGGCNLEGEMGIEFARSIPWVDYTVIGEGDHAFPLLLDRIAAGDRSFSLPNVAYRRGGEVVFGGRGSRVDLDASPTPNYEAFFDQAFEVDLPAKVRGQGLLIPFESARGCWWGQKHHCTFCSMNKEQMQYHAKSPRRTLEQLDELVGRYGVYTLGATDNILDPRYVSDVFGPLAEQRKDYRLAYEVKANLTQAQMKALARGGVTWMQPGIESLNSHILELMDKGATGIINVRMMKWARYYGIFIGWHVLTGFPGERREDYEDQLRTMRLIVHLQPPSTVSFPIRVEKFSPNYTRSHEIGFRNLRPGAPYGYLYPSSVKLEEVALFFDCESPDTLPREVFAETDGHIRDWIRRWRSDDAPYLVYKRGPDRVTILDGREEGGQTTHVFCDLAADVYEACNATYRDVSGVVRELQANLQRDIDPVEIAAVLDMFADKGFMLREKGKYLSLALPANPNW